MKLAARMGRLGTESAFEVLARAGALARAGRSVINLGIGQPDFATAPHIVEAACRALRDGHHGYTDAAGILPLREAVAAHLEESTGARVDPTRILITPGGKVAMFFAMLACGEAGREIVYPDPGFPIYESAIAFSGARPRPYRLHEALDFSFRAEEILDALGRDTALLILNSPGNPTGGVADPGELEALARGLEAHPEVVVLSDEIYRRIAYDGVRPRSLLEWESLHDRLIVLDGWSKTYAMTGWRLGFSVWPERMMEGVTRLAINDHSCVNAAAQHAGLAALEGPQDGVAAMVGAFDTRRRAVVEALRAIPGVQCATPRGAFYCFPNVSQVAPDVRVLQDALLEEVGVATVAGTSFGAGGEGFLRISYATELDAALEAVARMETYLGRRS